MSNGIPKGWISVRLEDIVISRKGKKPATIYREPAKGRVPYVLIDEMEGRPIRYYTDDKNVPIASKEDVLVVWDGSIGKCARGLTGAIGSTIVALTPRGIESGFLEAFVKRSRSIIYQTSRGTGLQHINQKVFWDLDVPVPPSNEQRKLLSKLEKLLEKVDTSEKSLTKISGILKRFRQSVLAAAYSGRLTADWRYENSDVEPAKELLLRIKNQRLADAQSTKEKNQIIESFQKKSLVVAEDELAAREIPDTWLTCRIGAVGTVVNGSTPSRKSEKYWDGDIPWVSSGEVRNNIITETREKITKEGFNNCSVRMLPQGTVLLAMIGEGKTRGQSAILRIAATINQNIAAILLTHRLISSEYLWRWFQFQYISTRERGSGSGPQALNCQRVRELPFILPPYHEQLEIIRRLETLFALVDKINVRHTKAQVQVDKLTQSILAKAFRGELVPQDPNDEPASVLLDKIKVMKGKK